MTESHLWSLRSRSSRSTLGQMLNLKDSQTLFMYLGYFFWFVDEVLFLWKFQNMTVAVAKKLNFWPFLLYWTLTDLRLQLKQVKYFKEDSFHEFRFLQFIFVLPIKLTTTLLENQIFDPNYPFSGNTVTL